MPPMWPLRPDSVKFESGPAEGDCDAPLGQLSRTRKNRNIPPAKHGQDVTSQSGVTSGPGAKVAR